MTKIDSADLISFAKDEFHCHGAFEPMHKGKTDEWNLKAAQAFAAGVVTKYQ